MRKLMTDAQAAKMLQNGAVNDERRATGRKTEDFTPVVKLFYPLSDATFLLTELDTQDPDVAFGLADLGFGAPKLGYVRISEIAKLQERLRVSVERDRYFTPKKTLDAYAREARKAGRLIA